VRGTNGAGPQAQADLVVPAPASVQLACRGTDELVQAALVGRVDVLVRRLDLEGAGAPLAHGRERSVAILAQR